MKRAWVVRGVIFLVSVLATFAVLTLAGGGQDTSEYEVGDLARQDFYAEKAASDIVDSEETTAREEKARAEVNEDDARELQPEIEDAVETQVNAVFDDAASVVLSDGQGVAQSPVPELPEEPTTTTAASDGSASTTPEPATVTGLVFIDVDGDGAFDPESQDNPGDAGIAGVEVSVESAEGTTTVMTESDGTWSTEIGPGSAVISVSPDDGALPNAFVPGADDLGQLVECGEGATCETEPMGFVASLVPAEEAAATLKAGHPLPDETLAYLVQTASEDVTRLALGRESHLGKVREAALNRLASEWGRRITEDDLQQAKAALRDSPPPVIQEGSVDVEGGAAAGDILWTYLLPNYVVNQTKLEELRNQAALAVDDVTVDFTKDQRIVSKGETLTALDIAAIKATAAPSIAEEPTYGLLGVIVVLVGLVGLYLAQFRPEFWERPRMIALLGILIVLAAGAVRATVVLSDSFGWYVLPAVAFGLLSSVLFDQRIAILMALTLGVLTAAGSLDTGATVYAMLAALAPIPFVSSVSSRGAFRSAVVYSSIAAAAIAAATSWFFHVGPNDVTVNVVTISVAWAFGVSALSSLLGLAALQFFESAFDITTTLRLLDLTDRNHEALQMLQEEAFGTFNHSLMVGTLADAAARSIGANPLLARAMAYYHDLGKTENPTYFIENQFGMANPHDDLDPKESAEIVRNHVPAGVALARRYKIPTEVTEGIVSHHGDGVMRYFYEQARQQQGVDVDIDDFRHIGHKPRTAESAILMLADSLEAACRAVFQSEEPTSDSIEKVVNRVMDEKLEDGQLSESPLTLGELTKIRKAFLDSLKGHYHQRIAYPNFPGS
jgi:putative nucleotidyltransferase with HDIG domain